MAGSVQRSPGSAKSATPVACGASHPAPPGERPGRPDPGASA
ncbi:hypothetical protein ATSB10_20930 [Dyella thiooxydans]|uniref:Uncharacterized protein n=1 Tax=Dyella thiooxydans TaxID=445710 RepID=A0A160N1Z6_9GAMM|nr:hypothetical protein ATSB10_20930 [Dyella thiooxydans]